MKYRRKNIIIILLPLIIIPLVYMATSVYRTFKILVFPCPFYTFMHIYCPGCGGTRCIYALLEGDIVRAIRYNALFISAIVLGILFWIENIMAAIGKNVKIIPRSNVVIIIASGIAALYVILRNFIPFLAP